MLKVYAKIVENEGASHYFRPYEHSSIYDMMMDITGNDHEISCDIASWCELANVGEVYTFREGYVEIVEE